MNLIKDLKTALEVAGVMKHNVSGGYSERDGNRIYACQNPKCGAKIFEFVQWKLFIGSCLTHECKDNMRGDQIKKRDMYGVKPCKKVGRLKF